jgi:23S rRNA (adenine2030-N6)-methyltransferase
MNYNHAYHAGNFADVIKHIVLICLIENLKKKPAPFHVIDAFAGGGLYDLDSCEALKTNESSFGYSKLKSYKSDIPEIISNYIKICSKYSSIKSMYAGSPIIISELIREIDRSDFCELKEEAFYELKTNLKKIKKKVASHKLDGYLSLKSLLPPMEKRGLVLLDPPFEETDEFDKLISSIELISKRYLQATTLIWYPIKDITKVRGFYEEVKKIGRETLKIEFSIDKSITNMNSTGLLIINPPFIEEQINSLLKFLRDKIYDNRAKFIISKLN